MRELDLITALETTLRRGGPQVVRWLGDDAAVVRGRGYAVTSVDTMVENVHFRSSQLSGEEIGHRALAAALSDLAAMGARAGEAYLALGLPDEEVEAKQTAELVASAIAALTPQQRAALLLREAEGLTYEQIAKVLGVSVAAVKSRLNRARMEIALAMEVHDG